MNTINSSILDFYQSLNTPDNLPKNIETMNPYLNTKTWVIVEKFYRKYYNDLNPRIALFGINPGRFGAGVTGIPFTDPIHLETHCQIKNEFDKRSELSSKFIYDLITAYGGSRKFYSKFFITGVSPLGYLQDGKNINYYELPGWKSIFETHVIKWIEEQLDFLKRSFAICIGQGENFKYLNDLNKKHNFFSEIRPTPHPRWVMQYRLKRKEEYIQQFISALSD